MVRRMTVGTNGNPLSWRDVYRAVGESEARVLRAVGDLGSRVLGVQSDHETRLRVVETRSSKTSGVFATVSGTQRVLITLGAIVGPVIAIIALWK
jgi:hypothetical protein